MLLKAAVAALVLAFVTPASSQEPTPLDAAILACVGPGFIPDGDPFEVLDALDQRYCTRVCKASARSCKAVAKAIDRCGVSFLKASAKVGIEICRGLGYTAQECRGINAEANADIDWWKAQGRIERDECDSEAETLCLSRCQSAAARALYETLVPAPLLERPQREDGGAIVYLNFEEILPPNPLPENPEGGAALDAIQYLDPRASLPSVPPLEAPQGQAGLTITTSQIPERAPLAVREQAKGVVEFLE